MNAQPRIRVPTPPPPPPNQTQISAHPHPTYLSDNEIEIEIDKVLIRGFPEGGVFPRVFYRNLVLLLLHVLLQAFTVLLQNKNTTLIAENGENLLSAQP